MSSFTSDTPPHTRIVTIEISDEDIKMLNEVRSFLHISFPPFGSDLTLASRFSIWYHQIEEDL